MGHLKLIGSDRKWLRTSLENSFTAANLREVVLETYPSLDPHITWNGSGGLAVVVSSVIDAANQRGVLPQLVVAAAGERPFVEDLTAIMLKLSTYPEWTPRLEKHGFDLKSGLEGLTSPGGGFIDTTRFARWLIRTERQVCRVRCGADLGTGFLIGPDLVLTCYHVVQEHLDKLVPAAEVAVRFDYRRDERGNAPSEDPRSWIGIDPTWAIPHSRYSEKDVSLSGEPAADELDYALLKLSRTAGHEVPAGEQNPRRWVDVSADRPLPAPSTPILIVQHPGIPGAAPPAQQPLQIAFEGRGFEGPTGPLGVRVAYRPSTLCGSSGSPVYDASLLAVALHHNRGQIDPSIQDLHLNNRGIPLSKIRAHLSPELRTLLLPSG